MSLRVRYVGLDRVAAAVVPGDHCIAVPEYLFAAAAQLWPGRRVLPYYGLHPGDPPPDLAILHKGLLNRLSRPVLRDILDAGRPVLATEDFLLVRPALRVAADSVRLDWLEDAARLRAWAVRPAPAAPPDPSGTALIASAYGLGNIGDDAVTLVAGRIAAQAGFRRVILAGAVASFDLVRDADVVMLGGGGLLYDTADGGAPRAQNVAYYAGLLRHAQELGRATAVLGIGVQGIHTPLGRTAYAEVLRRAAHVSVRDPGDLQVLREEVGVDHAVLAADLGFGLAPWVWPAVAGQARRLALVVPGVLSARIGAEADAAWAGLIRCLGQVQEVVIVQHTDDDRALCARLAKLTGARLEVLTGRGVVRSAELYRQAGTVVTARYHGLIFGLLHGCRMLPVTTPGGKQGRLIRWALPSLAGALTPIDRFLDGEATGLLAQAALPHPSEVAALQGRVMELPGQLATALGGRRRLETTMAAIRADLAAAPEEAEPQAIAA
jgi:polysaccharide pyruvyl transferase WcaK-like protein